jgi:hypothetical protein
MWMLQTLGCFGEQLQSCRQIPVGRGRIYVPKISRKQRETLLRVRTIPVGLQHRVNGERMTQVMNTGATMSGARHETGLTDQPLEGPLNVFNT